MILTLNVDCIGSLIANPKGRGEGTLSLGDVGSFAAGELGLAGLSLPTRLLTGIDRAGLESLRERYDKARCSCLQLVESGELFLANPDVDACEASLNRVTRVMQAAHYLGCNSAAIRVTGDDSDNSLSATAQALRRVIPLAERLELNLLIAPHDGLTSSPERVTDLLKRVGGFRLGTFPDF